MSTYLPMSILAAILVCALAAAAIAVYSRWRRSRAPSKQVPPEEPTYDWIYREAENAHKIGKGPEA
ncbi:hypothetical protein JZX87_30780 [Agrobacterium sp. Ap1]|jgi:hypothetical protein|uniref:hypothetical protein n=1 Tax=Rhizobium/Agrobacterium group TaxID=227290 RepID=UPI0011D0AAA4|nr:hypothetical protein [Agrobacterium sp. Ap1]MBO0145502.1 hypothetical protein [Agrobacterium sp. Ap1]